VIKNEKEKENENVKEIIRSDTIFDEKHIKRKILAQFSDQ
jgi:hypothetical protein